MRIEATQTAATMELTGIPKEAFTSCFQDLQKRWQQCIDCGGNYFSKRTGSISCEVEFCIFYRLSLRTLRTKDVLIRFKAKTLRSVSHSITHIVFLVLSFLQLHYQKIVPFTCKLNLDKMSALKFPLAPHKKHTLLYYKDQSINSVYKNNRFLLS
jgi:hypothetical protein